MKPGNLSERKRCQIRRQTKDEDSIQRTSDLRCAIFILSGSERRFRLLHGAVSSRFSA